MEVSVEDRHQNKKKETAISLEIIIKGTNNVMKLFISWIEICMFLSVDVQMSTVKLTMPNTYGLWRQFPPLLLADSMYVVRTY